MLLAPNAPDAQPPASNVDTMTAADARQKLLGDLVEIFITGGVAFSSFLLTRRAFAGPVHVGGFGGAASSPFVMAFWSGRMVVDFRSPDGRRSLAAIGEAEFRLLAGRERDHILFLARADAHRSVRSRRQARRGP